MTARRVEAARGKYSCDVCGHKNVPLDGLTGSPYGFATVVTGDPEAVLCRRCWWAANMERLRKEREQ